MLDYMIWPFFERYPSLTVLSKGLYRVNMDKFPKLVILIILVAFENILKINLAHFRIYFLGEMEQWNDWRWRCQASLHNSWKSRHIYYVLFNRNTRLWYDTTLKIVFLKKEEKNNTLMTRIHVTLLTLLSGTVYYWSSTMRAWVD